jgi:hypothetical protein
VLGLGIAGLATFGAFHFAKIARASDSPLSKFALALAWLDAAALLALAFGLFS